MLGLGPSLLEDNRNRRPWMPFVIATEKGLLTLWGGVVFFLRGVGLPKWSPCEMEPRGDSKIRADSSVVVTNKADSRSAVDSLAIS